MVTLMCSVAPERQPRASANDSKPKKVKKIVFRIARLRDATVLKVTERV